MASTTSLYDPSIVYMAMVGTAVIVVCLILYASSTERDFTGYYPYLWIFCLSLCLFGIFCIWSPFTYAIYSALGVFLFSAYIVCDTQLIVGGKGRAELGVDDYVFGALLLYLDIINLFLYLLSFLSLCFTRISPLGSWLRRIASTNAFTTTERTSACDRHAVLAVSQFSMNPRLFSSSNATSFKNKRNNSSRASLDGKSNLM